MKAIKLLGTVLFVAIMLSSCGTNAAELKKPTFPQLAQEMNISEAELKIQLTDTAIVNELPVYRVSNKKMDQSRINQLLSVFGFTEPIIETGKDPSNRAQTVYREGDKELCIIHNGNYVYLDHQRAEDVAVTLSDDEVKRRAEKFLRENGLFPDGFFAGGVGYSTLETLDSDPVIFEKTAGFFRKIDGYDVYGHSDITVTYNARGIAAVYSVFNDYVLDRSLACKTLQEAQTKILSSDSWLNFDGSKVGQGKSIQITNCEIVYYDDASSANDFIQPCLSFKGSILDSKGNTTAFSSVVPALKEACYQ